MIAACCGNVSFYLFGPTGGQTWWEPQEQEKHCETRRLLPPAPPFVLHLQPHRICSRAEMNFVMYLLLFILALDIFPNFSLSSLYLLRQTMRVFPAAPGLPGSTPAVTEDKQQSWKNSGAVMRRMWIESWRALAGSTASTAFKQSTPGKQAPYEQLFSVSL